MTSTRKQRIEEMLAEDPNDAFLRYGLAMEFVGEKNDEQAVQCLDELIARSPDYVPAYLQAGQALMRLGKSDEARQIWQRGIAIADGAYDRHAADEMRGFIASIE